jgi:hypothetical protein
MLLKVKSLQKLQREFGGVCEDVEKDLESVKSEEEGDEEGGNGLTLKERRVRAIKERKICDAIMEGKSKKDVCSEARKKGSKDNTTTGEVTVEEKDNIGNAKESDSEGKDNNIGAEDLSSPKSTPRSTPQSTPQNTPENSPESSPQGTPEADRLSSKKSSLSTPDRNAPEKSKRSATPKGILILPKERTDSEKNLNQSDKNESGKNDVSDGEKKERKDSYSCPMRSIARLALSSNFGENMIMTNDSDGKHTSDGNHTSDGKDNGKDDNDNSKDRVKDNASKKDNDNSKDNTDTNGTPSKTQTKRLKVPKSVLDVGKIVGESSVFSASKKTIQKEDLRVMRHLEIDYVDIGATATGCASPQSRSMIFGKRKDL